MIRNLGNQKSRGIPNKVLDGDGKVVTKVLNVWKSYFENLLNVGQAQHKTSSSLPDT